MASNVQGLDRLLRQLRAMPLAITNAAAIEVAEAAQTLAGKIATAAPRGRTGKLAASVKARPRTTADSRARSSAGPQLASLKASRQLSWLVVAGGKGVPYAGFVEFGTAASQGSASRLYKVQKGKSRGKVTGGKRAHAATPAQPFFWPTVRAQKKSIRSRMARRLNAAVKAVATVP